MPPIRIYRNWNTRDAYNVQIEPYKRYYFLCEGRKTEKLYFESLIKNRKELSIHSLIDIDYIERTENDVGISKPEQLIKFAKKLKANKRIVFDKNIDKIIIVFDADVLNSKSQDIINNIIADGESDGSTIIGLTNPAFELFLILHYESSYENTILPNSEEIIKNDWVKKSENKKERFILNLLKREYDIKSKSHSEIENLVHKINIAISQERKINSQIYECKDTITSNIGSIINQIITDDIG